MITNYSNQPELMGGKLKDFIKKKRAEREAKEKANPKKGRIRRALRAIASGGVSEIARSKKAGGIAAAIATGGMSRIVKNKKARNIAAAIATGGMSRLAQSKKARIAAGAIATGGMSLLFNKGKAGKIAKFAFAPLTSTIGLIASKRKARREEAAAGEAAAADTAQTADIAAQEAELVQQEKSSGIKKFLPLILGAGALLPMLMMGEDQR